MIKTWRAILVACLLGCFVLLAGCLEENRPALPELPDISQIPGIPSSLEDVPDLLNELQIPDLSQIGVDLPSLEELPALRAEPGTVLLRGPYEVRVRLGERIPGTDIELVSVNELDAEFRIAGMRSVRTIGDSLQFDGAWPGLEESAYYVRLRIYRIDDNSVRAAGVHQLQVRDVQPTLADIDTSAEAMRFPIADSAAMDTSIADTTFVYAGMDDRGAEISGLPADTYSYFNVGDRIRWEGRLRSDLPVRYNMRVLFYDADSVQVGGVALVYLPGL
jgi:hypothetical protein